MIPNELICDPNLTATEFRILAALMSYDWADTNGVRKGVVWPAMSTLGEQLGLSRRAVLNILQRLEDKGYIAKVYGGGGRTRPNVYAVVVGQKTVNLRSQFPVIHPKTVNLRSQFSQETVNFEAQNCERTFTRNILKNKTNGEGKENEWGAHSASPNEHAANAAQTQTPTTTFENLSQTAVPATATATPESVVSGLVAALGYEAVARLLGEAAIEPTAAGVVVHIPQALAEGWDNPTRTEVLTAIAGCGAVAVVGDGPGMVHPRTREADIPTPRAG